MVSPLLKKWGWGWNLESLLSLRRTADKADDEPGMQHSLLWHLQKWLEETMDRSSLWFLSCIKCSGLTWPWVNQGEVGKVLSESVVTEVLLDIWFERIGRFWIIKIFSQSSKKWKLSISVFGRGKESCRNRSRESVVSRKGWLVSKDSNFLALLCIKTSFRGDCWNWVSGVCVCTCVLCQLLPFGGG